MGLTSSSADGSTSSDDAGNVRFAAGLGSTVANAITEISVVAKAADVAGGATKSLSLAEHVLDAHFLDIELAINHEQNNSHEWQTRKKVLTPQESRLLIALRSCAKARLAKRAAETRVTFILNAGLFTGSVM